jgi:exodeoxyribonuclease V alpha subunit
MVSIGNHTVHTFLLAFGLFSRARLLRLSSYLCAAVDTPHRQSEATTIHRLLEYKPPGGFTRNASNPINADAVVVDEASMLDISLARELCAALDPKTYLVLIGDPDQLPSIGAGNVRIQACRAFISAKHAC